MLFKKQNVQMRLWDKKRDGERKIGWVGEGSTEQNFPEAAAFKLNLL